MGEFLNRHVGLREQDRKEMLDIVKAKSLDQLIEETIPAKIRLKEELDIPESLTEFEYLRELRQTAAKNKVYKSYIGLGYYNTITPSPILRNIFENPGWYTQYTPYQSEISQGRLEALLNYQTMVSDLTGFPVTNASLLDEGTAVSEAMIMFFNIRNKGKDIEVAKFFVSDKCFPQTIDILHTRAEPLGIEIVVDNYAEANLDNSYFGAALQYPDADGQINNYKSFIEKAHAQNVKVVMAADLMSLALITPPAELGADVAVGNTQRFGVPLGYGGPHAAYFSTTEDYKRQMPGRIIGLSIDAHDNPAYRMALQTREQHIRREKATSNICTAQALLAIMAGTYGVYHGPEGIKNIATKISATTQSIAKALSDLGYEQLNSSYFDTIKIKANKSDILPLAEKAKINFRYIDDNHIGISIDETTLLEDAQAIINVFAEAKGQKTGTLSVDFKEEVNAKGLIRASTYLTHKVFNSYHSETELIRYLKSLENKDLSLTKSMISLGSCTMKLNAASELLPVTWSEFSQIHPFVPLNQTEGYQAIFKDLENYLSNITGFAATSLQPNSGAQGEYAGLLVIRAFHHDNGDHHRDVVLIPASAHGTNPASGVMAGMKVVVTKCDEQGNIDVADLKEKAEQYKDTLSALMVTYPSTHGVFEDSIQEVCQLIHDNGGQVYMDGANMNAQVGLTSPANIGADVCHLNLHKTFAIPHGGGGPGVGTISVAKHLAPFLPGNPLVKTGGEKAIKAVSSAPWGSANIMLISYGYIKMLGYDGLKASTKNAILNANYLKNRLEKYYPILYVGDNGRVAHEFIIDFRPIKAETGVEVEDIAKRLMDYSFHAPTVSFPVAGTLMVEPTESEPKAELDRFCDALIAIKSEIDAIGAADKEDNLLKNAPHTADEIVSAEWNHSYSREQAVFPLPFVKNNKFWPAVKRVNNSHGDRHLICTCPPTEAYAEEVVA